ncbi:MAG: serine protease [Bacteriovoracia bacterium]
MLKNSSLKHFIVFILLFCLSSPAAFSSKRGVSKIILGCAALLMPTLSLFADDGDVDGHHPFSNHFTYVREAKEGDIAPSVSASMSKVVRLQAEAGWGSGFFVSNDGYLLTARHVIDRLLPKEAVRTDPMCWSMYGFNRHCDIASVATQVPADMTIKVGIFDSNDTLVAQEAKVVFLGSKVLDGPVLYGTAINRVDENDLSSRFQDFAILKIQTSGQAPMIQVRRSTLPVGTEVWDVGYPGMDKMPDPHPDKLQLVISKGKTIDNYRSPVFSPEIIRSMYAQVGMSDTPVRWGFSGGPVLDKDGIAIGVIIHALPCCSRWDSIGTGYVPMKYIYDTVEKKLGVARARQMFAAVDPKIWY